MDNLARVTSLGSAGSAQTYFNAKVELQEEPFLGLLKLTARDLSADDYAAISRAAGVDVTATPCALTEGEQLTVGWLSPQEWIFIGIESAILPLQRELSEIFSQRAALITDISQARAALLLSGAGAPEVLSSLSPMDFSADRFGVNHCVRTQFGETSAFVHRVKETNNFRIIIDQSFATYAWRLLKDACENIFRN